MELELEVELEQSVENDCWIVRLIEDPRVRERFGKDKMRGGSADTIYMYT